MDLKVFSQRFREGNLAEKSALSRGIERLAAALSGKPDRMLPALGSDAMGKFYRELLARKLSEDSRIDPVFFAILHFACIQRDFESSGVGAPKPLTLLLDSDCSTWQALTPELANLHSGLVQLGTGGKFRNKTAGLSASGAGGSSETSWKVDGLTAELTQSLEREYTAHVIALSTKKPAKAIVETLQRLSSTANTGTVVILKIKSRDIKDLDDALKSKNENIQVTDSLDCGAFQLVIIENFFKNFSHNAVDLKVNPAMKPVNANNVDQIFYPIRHIRDIATTDQIDAGSLDRVKEATSLILRPEHKFIASTKPKVIMERASGKTVEQLTQQEFLIKDMSLSFLPNAIFNGMGVAITQDNRIFEESFLPPVDPGEYSTWGPSFPLSEGKDQAYIGFLDQRFLVAGKPGYFRPRKRPVPSRTIDGPVLLVGALYHHVYSHWLIDVLSKLWVLPHLENMGLGGIPVAISGPLSAKQKEMLHYAGVSQDRLIELGPEEWVDSDMLLVPSRPARMYDYIAPEVFDLYDTIADRALAAMKIDTSAFPKRIYAARQVRSGRRRWINEDRILQQLDKRDYRPVEFAHLSVADEISLFRNAVSIAAPHGSALGGIVFMREQAKVCCFFYPELMRVIRHHFTITAHRKLELLAVGGQSFSMRTDMSSWLIDEDIVADGLDQFEAC